MPHATEIVDHGSGMTKQWAPMNSSRITQLLLAALVITQVPHFISFIYGLNRYESPEAALRACNQWAERAGKYTVKRTGIWTSYSQAPVRICLKEGDHYVGSEIPLDGATEVGQHLDDPKGFHSDSVPKSEDSGKRWRFRRNKWSITIPL